jgi:hypothetical protein
MLRLFFVLMSTLAAALAATVCWTAVLVELARREGLRRAALGVLCPPWAFAWGWRQRRGGGWMFAWTGSTAYWLGSMAFLQLAMG